jgi:hypothetical protein
MADGADLQNRFSYHAPKGDQAERYEHIRAEALRYARLINENTPASREQSLALTHLEDAVMWANAAIARNE